MTDYTRNELLKAPNSAWCPAEFGQYVLKIEMWEAAAKLGPQMKPETFWEMDNVRMKIGQAGYHQGTISDAKIYPLSEKDAGNDPKLAALLL